MLSVDYRLAPEHPIPAPLDDCYAALSWLHENATDLGVDPQRIGIGGESAGGGLAAALAIKARDAGEYPICWQALTYPMLDNRTGSEAYPGDALVGEFVWTRELNQYGWQSYLGQAAPEAPQVPARLQSFEGLPPTWMFTALIYSAMRILSMRRSLWPPVCLRAIRLPRSLPRLSKNRTSRPPVNAIEQTYWQRCARVRLLTPNLF